MLVVIPSMFLLVFIARSGAASDPDLKDA